jgi:hypothetical protein
MLAQIKAFIAPRKEQLAVSLILVLVALFSFGLGRLSVMYADKGDLEILYPETENTLLPEGVLMGQNRPFVASKTGEKYFPPGCTASSVIAQENKLYFKTAVEAEARGYVLSKSCEAP